MRRKRRRHHAGQDRCGDYAGRVLAPFDQAEGLYDRNEPDQQSDAGDEFQQTEKCLHSLPSRGADAAGKRARGR